MKSLTVAVNTTCLLCNEEQESCSHLFFGCRFSRQIWRTLIWRAFSGWVHHGLEHTQNALLLIRDSHQQRPLFLGMLCKQRCIQYGENGMQEDMENILKILAVWSGLWTGQWDSGWFQYKGRDSNTLMKVWSLGSEYKKLVE